MTTTCRLMCTRLNRTTSLTFLLCLVAGWTFLFGPQSPARAAVLVSWDVDGVELDGDPSGIDDSPASSPYTFSGTLGTNIGGGELTLSSTVNGSTASGQYGFKVSAGNEESTLSGAITAEHFIQFTVTAANGFLMNLSNIGMKGQSSATGADDVAVLSNIGGFVDTQVLDSVSSIAGFTGGFDTDASGFGGPIDLSGSEFQGISSATFRIYGFNTSSGSGITYVRSLSGNDLVINGTTVVIPEPSTFLLGIIGVFVLGCCGHRRRRA
jgi:hypothetical protein